MKDLFLICSIGILLSCGNKEYADLIVHNASIYTVNDDFQMAEAMAIRGDRILEVGAEHQILNKYQATNLIDTSNQFIYPGFIDAHSHLSAYAKTLGQVNLVGVKSELEMIDRIRNFIDVTSTKYVIGIGWDETNWESGRLPDNSWCDSLFPGHYFFLQRIDGHAVLVSSNLMDEYQITAESEFEGGKVMVKNGKASGILIDNAMTEMRSSLDEMEHKKLKTLLPLAEKKCFEVGLTSVTDAGLSFSETEFIRSMYAQKMLQMRLYIMLEPEKANFDHYLKKGPYVDEFLSIRSFKIYCDGALGSRGALLKEPYTDAEEAHFRGLLLTDSIQMSRWADTLNEYGFQMNTHAIGDGANRLMLQIYGNTLKGVNDKRWRIEHAQVVADEDFALFKKFTIIPSAQPTHATSDMNWAEERLGSERIRNAYNYRRLKEQNGMIALGTDFPIEDIDPKLTVLAAVSRKDSLGQPEHSYFPENGLDFEDCIRGMTIWAAMANFEEDIKGSLEPGKKADFVIFNKDLKDLKADNFQSFQVQATYLNGKNVYELKK